MTTIEVRRAPTKTKKKWEALLPGGKIVRFGARGYSDFTLHGDPRRMVRYVQRHGGGGTSAQDGDKITRVMLSRARSSSENWGATGVDTPGFWSRWLLWSYPDIRNAARHTEKVLKGKYSIKIKK